jgi:hypothetical protein
VNGLALCAGIGGLELGLRRALGPSYRAVIAAHERKQREAMVESPVRHEQGGTLSPNAPEVSLGVGDGTGNLFVHGSYEAITKVREMMAERDALQEAERRRGEPG